MKIILQQYISKESSLADWLVAALAFFTLLVGLYNIIKFLIIAIANWFMFPKFTLLVSGIGNISISEDKAIRKIQIPIDFENFSNKRILIEKIGLIIIGPASSEYSLKWHKFIKDVMGKGTMQDSNPYTIEIKQKSLARNFIQFYVDRNITFIAGLYKFDFKITASANGKKTEKIFNYAFKIDDKKIKEIETNRTLAKPGYWPLVSIEIDKI